MPSNSSTSDHLDFPQANSSSEGATERSKLPRLILEGVFAFPPNRDTLGATAYLIVENGNNVLIDCPYWSLENYQFLLKQGGVRSLFITHRGGIAQVDRIQKALGCQVIIQEQEAYLLPQLDLNSFGQEITLSSNLRAIWTPGHSPGSSCLYWRNHGGVLFTGRHLLPHSGGEPTPLKTPKTFHWYRQLQSVRKLGDRFNSQTLQYICPGANSGFLAGKGLIDQAYQRLLKLDLEGLQSELFL